MLPPPADPSSSPTPDVGIEVPPPGVPWSASLAFPLWVPGQGLSGNVGGWLSECVSKPPPSSSHDLLLYWALLGPLPQLCIADCLWPVDAQYSAETGINKRLDPVLSGLGCPSCLGSIEQHRLDVCVKKAQLD